MTVERLPTGSVDPTTPDQPWWRYKRPELPVLVVGEPVAPPVARFGPPDGLGDDQGERDDVTLAAPPRPGAGVLPAILAVALSLAIVAFARFTSVTAAGRVLVPIAGVLLAAAIAPVLVRRHPDEPWLARLVVWGAAFKVVSSILRYYTLVDGYGTVGDATNYHEYGSQLVRGVAEELTDRRRTNFVRFVVGALYQWAGVDIIMGFFVFGFVAFVGSYLWYRATVRAVPFVDKRLYCAFVFFAPSIAFWPSSIGKEALMQLGMGVAALGASTLLTGRPLRGLAIAAPGCWLLWVVRPHLFALAALAAGFAYLVGRRPKKSDAPGDISLLRPIVTVLVGFLVMFALTQAANFLGMEDFSIKSIEQELSDTSARTAQGGSEIGEGDGTEVQLTPLTLPLGMVTVLLRPFPWEVENGFQILAALEAVVLAGLIWVRRSSLALSLREARTTPFFFYCWTFIAIYATAFSSFRNMGLLVRQRSLAFPALFVLLAVDVTRARRRAAVEA